MKQWINILKVVILIVGIILLIGITVIYFNVQLYKLYKQQGMELNSVKDRLDVETEFNSNKFKYQEDQVDNLRKDLEDVQQQVKDQKSSLADERDALGAQKDALLQEIEKRQQLENAGKGIQASLVDIKAEADAIKEDMRGWQKDYVSVLAELEKKMDDSQVEIGSVKEDINSLKVDIEKMAHPVDNTLSSTPPPAPEKKIERADLQS